MAKVKKAEIKPKEKAKAKPGVKVEKAKPVEKKTTSAVKGAAKAKVAEVKPVKTSTAKTEKKPSIKVPSKGNTVKKAVGVGSGNSKIPCPKDVKEINKKLEVAMKPVVVNPKSKFGTAKTAYSPDQEVVTNTNRSSPSLTTARRK
jgi:hypothetical protein